MSDLENLDNSVEPDINLDPANTEPAENTEEEQGNQEPENKEAPQKKKGQPLHARFRQLTTQRREDQARIEELENTIRNSEKAALIEEPNKDNYADLDDYIQQKDKYTNQQLREKENEAIENYKINEKYQKEQRNAQAVVSNYQAKDRPKAIEEYKDYAKSEQEVGKAVFDYRIPELENDILGSTANAAIIDFLGSDLEKLDELAYMYKSDPRSAARAFGRLEASLAKAPTKRKPGPDPLPKTGAGAGAVDKDPADMSQKEYNIYKKNN